MHRYCWLQRLPGKFLSPKLRLRLSQLSTSDRIRQGDSQGQFRQSSFFRLISYLPAPAEPIVLEDDGSNNNTVTRLNFRTSKPGSEIGGFDSRRPISLSHCEKDGRAMSDRESQPGGKDVNRDDSTVSARKRRRHGNRDQVGKRHDNALFGVPTEDDDGDDAVEIRDGNRPRVLQPLLRDAKGTANLTFRRAKKRLRSASSGSSSSDRSYKGGGLLASRKKIAQSTSRSSRPRRHCR